MGLLDDAIREHLELKRRRGADPAEIERAEQEALGPVRRAPEEDEPAEVEPAAQAGEGQYSPDVGDDWADPFAEDSEAFAEESELFGDERAPLADEGPFDHGERFDRDAPGPDSSPPEAAAPQSREPESPPREPSRPIADPDSQTQIFNQDPEDAAPPPPRAAPPPHPAPPSSDQLSDQTVEFDVSQEHDEEHGAGDEGEERPAGQEGEKKSDEDVLEETPEFLQDTPDHDRLWFEQRPPRDFDFDG